MNESYRTFITQKVIPTCSSSRLRVESAKDDATATATLSKRRFSLFSNILTIIVNVNVFLRRKEQLATRNNILQLCEDVCDDTGM